MDAFLACSFAFLLLQVTFSLGSTLLFTTGRLLSSLTLSARSRSQVLTSLPKAEYSTGPLADVDAQLEQFAPDAFCSPESVICIVHPLRPPVALHRN
jgi:hypothetical protein